MCCYIKIVTSYSLSWGCSPAASSFQCATSTQRCRGRPSAQSRGQAHCGQGSHRRSRSVDSSAAACFDIGGRSRTAEKQLWLLLLLGRQRRKQALENGGDDDDTTQQNKNVSTRTTLEINCFSTLRAGFIKKRLNCRKQ